jgi:glutamine synthetase adenylyltransferase
MSELRLPDPKTVDQPKYINGSVKGEAARAGAQALGKVFDALTPDVVKWVLSPEEARKAQKRFRREHEAIKQQQAFEHMQKEHALDTAHIRKQVIKSHLNAGRLSEAPPKIGTAYRTEARTKTQGLGDARAELARMQANQTGKNNQEAYEHMKQKNASAQERYGAWYSGRAPYNRPPTAETRMQPTKKAA